MHPLPGEQILYKHKGFVLTTHRIRTERQGGGDATIKSVMLEEVVSCAMFRETYPLLLVMALVCCVGGLWFAVSAGVISVALGVALAIACVTAYLLNGMQKLHIASAGVTISLNVGDWPLSEIHELIDKVEEAKNSRFLALRVPPPVPSHARQP